ncbi:unnamed protein product [Cylindrotheca closterium]|uniref:AB hydrolase-1 domain-containing protein n=1 Tax=Cylindrotheca closterium TaxID=2856 RepID=A0AAD2CNX8_9STRA|nr:unnamed protein product [Cylindrotheca closterium]
MPGISHNSLFNARGLTLIVSFILLDISSCFLPTKDCVQFLNDVSYRYPLPNTKTSAHRSGRINHHTCRLAASISSEQYQHKDFKLTYLYKKAAPGREKDDPIIMVHPVGVGLSSWFWIRAMESFENNPPIYAPDLIGCGLEHGADPWDPEKGGLFFPLSWVEGIETLMQEVVGGGTQKAGCLVVVQGGLAPVGIMLAARNPDTVKALMLTSPPTHQDVITAVPQAELQRNYELLRSPILGNLAFFVLENRAIIRFFSDLFLFSEKCDNRWLDETAKESKFKQARTPVQAFNAGLLQHRSFEAELQESVQPLMVVSGDGDKRTTDREGYQSSRRANQKPCTLKTIGGTNVLPWENPSGIVKLIQEMGF